jgi:hypothetical protein
MSTTGGKVAEARAKQRAASRRATFEQLHSKKRTEQELTLHLGDEELTVLFRAIGTRDYDKLLSKHPPKPEQKVEGASYDINSFGPALIAATMIEPELTKDQAQELWDSEEWSRGEIMTLFRTAVEVCNRGLDIPFTGND